MPRKEKDVLIRTATLDELLIDATETISFKWILMFCIYAGPWLSMPATIYLISFAGSGASSSDPFSCLTQKCGDLLENWNATKDPIFQCITEKDADGKTDLVLFPKDYEWHKKKTSYKLEFDLLCGHVGNRMALSDDVKTNLFYGAFTSQIAGSFLYDQIGRKKCAVIGMLVSTSANVACSFCQNIHYFVILRCLQGFGVFFMITPMYLLSTETLPNKFRNTMNAMCMLAWSAGYGTLVLIGYLVDDWHQMYSAAAAQVFICCFPLVFCIDSPKYFLSRRDFPAAKRAINQLAALTGKHFDFDGGKIVLIETEQLTGIELSYFGQLKTLFQYYEVAVELLCSTWLWAYVSCAYYAFTMGPYNLWPDMYMGWVMYMLAEALAYACSELSVRFFGIRKTMVIFSIYAAINFILMMIMKHVGFDFVIPGLGWKFADICEISGITVITGLFGLAYLWSTELPPDSHRGMTFALNSAAARVGAAFGPKLFSSYLLVLPQWFPYALLGVMSAINVVVSMILPDTAIFGMVLKPIDVVKRRKQHKILSW